MSTTTSATIIITINTTSITTSPTTMLRKSRKLWMFTTIILTLILQFRLARCQIVKYEIKEEQPAGTKVGFISDNIKSPFASPTLMGEKTRYYFKQNDGLFRFDSVKNNLIVTNKTIDREEICRYRDPCILIYDVFTNITTTSVNTASSTGKTFFAGSRQQLPQFVAKIAITIFDVNDHAPKFSEDIPNPYFLDVLESSEPGKFLKLPSAEDPDAGNNGEISYTLRSVRSDGTFGDDKFNLSKVIVDETTHGLKLNLINRLDREREAIYKFTLVASDNGKPKKSSSLDLIINVIDVNDNSPQFEFSRYNVSVPENSQIGTEIVRISASDADEGLNGIVKYGWSEDTSKKFGEYFSIDSGTGWISLKKSLDYENSYQLGPIHLSVVASDQGTSKKSSYATVLVKIVDVNDNAPQIYFNTDNIHALDGGDDVDGQLNSEKEDVLLQVQENSPANEEIAFFSVLDRDEGKNGQIECTLRDISYPISNLISVVPTSRTAYVNKFAIRTNVRADREANPSSLEGLIACKDLGKPNLEAFRRFLLYISDENDNAPRFENPVYSVIVREDAPVGTVIANLQAIDYDQDENGKISYSIRPFKEKWNNILTIDEAGYIKTLSTLDCEKNSKMNFNVIAQDHGTPSLTAVTSFELNIEDVDEFAPVFDKSFYNFTMTKLVPENTVIGRVRARDKDFTEKYGKVIYKIFDGGNVANFNSIKERFFVNENLGDIKTKYNITNTETYNFTIIAGNPPGRWFPNIKTIVHIHVEIPKPVVVKKLKSPVFLFPNEENFTITLTDSVESNTMITQLLLVNYTHDSKPSAYLNGNPNQDDIPNSNQIYMFSILSGNEQNYFRLDPYSGVLEATMNLSSLETQQLQISSYNVEDVNKNATSNLTIIFLPPVVASSSAGNFFKKGNIDLNIIIAIVLACWIFFVLVCLIVFGVKRRVAVMKSQRRKEKNRYNCRLETVRNTASHKNNNNNASRASFKKQSSVNESNGTKNDNSDGYSDATASLIYNNINGGGSRCSSSLRKFNDKFISFNVDDDAPMVDYPLSESRMSCPFGENCSLHNHQPMIQRPLPCHPCQQPLNNNNPLLQQPPPPQQQPNEQQHEMEELNYYNERLNDFYNSPVFNSETFPMSYNILQQQQQQQQQRQQLQEPFLNTSASGIVANNGNTFKSFKPLRVPPTNKSTPASPTNLSPTTFFPITCLGYPQGQLQGQPSKQCCDVDDNIKVPMTLNLMTRSYREISKTPTTSSLKTTTAATTPFEECGLAVGVVPRRNSESHF